MSETLEERIQNAYTAALKSRDTVTVSVLRMLRTALKNEQIAKRGPLDEAASLVVVAREVKKRKEAITAFEQGGRPELAAKEQAELEVLGAYLPAQMGEEEVVAAVDRVIAATQPTGPADFGRVMGAAMKELKGKADGALVQDVVKRQLAHLAA